MSRPLQKLQRFFRELKCQNVSDVTVAYSLVVCRHHVGSVAELYAES